MERLSSSSIYLQIEFLYQFFIKEKIYTTKRINSFCYKHYLIFNKIYFQTFIFSKAKVPIIIITIENKVIIPKSNDKVNCEVPKITFLSESTA